MSRSTPSAGSSSSAASASASASAIPRWAWVAAASTAAVLAAAGVLLITRQRRSHSQRGSTKDEARAKDAHKSHEATGDDRSSSGATSSGDADPQTVVIGTRSSQVSDRLTGVLEWNADAHCVVHCAL